MNDELQSLAEDFPGVAFVDRPSCPICQTPGRRRHAAINIHPTKPVEFDFNVCPRCGHGWIHPMPTQPLLNYLYGRASPSVFGGFGPEQMTLPEQFCAAATAGTPLGRYFELGVGQGNLYRVFVDRGWQCGGIDPGDWSSALPCVVRDESALPEGFSADVLAAMDVLEHVVDPVATLQTMRKFAKPGAQLFCAMPNRRSARAYLQKQRWRMVRPLGHVNYFSKRSIGKAIQLAGFHVTSIRATDLCERRIPRNVVELRSRLFQILGLGDQLVAKAQAV